MSGTRHRVQGAFVVAEMAMALVLLAGAGLMVRSLMRLWDVDPGFNPQHVLTVGVSLSPLMMTAPPDAVRAAFREFDSKVSSIPGVEAVSQTWGALPMGGDDELTFWFEGQPKPSTQNEMNWAIDYIVEPGYLKTMGIPLHRGRFFTDQDNEHSQRVIVVDEVFARKFFPSQDPIGKRIQSSLLGDPAQIVGVVGHVKQWGLDVDDTESLRTQVYIPCMQMPDASSPCSLPGQGWWCVRITRARACSTPSATSANRSAANRSSLTRNPWTRLSPIHSPSAVFR